MFSNQPKSDVNDGNVAKNGFYGGFPLSTPCSKSYSFGPRLEYESFDEKIRTFDGWPKAMPIKAYELAHEGFTYTGKVNKVASTQDRSFSWNNKNSNL